MAHSFKLNFAQCKFVNVKWKLGKDKNTKRKEKRKMNNFIVYQIKVIRKIKSN